MVLEFKLPDIGEGIAEGEIVKWLVNEGDRVAEHQAVVEVMTDKATVEIPAPRAGRVSGFRARPGDVVPVGQVIFLLEAGPEAEAPVPRVDSSSSAPKAPPAPLPRGTGSTLMFKLPDIGEGIAEGEIVKWLVKDGEAVKEHQPVVEVMTDKATVEIPAPAAGTVSALRVKAGQVVPIGTVLFDLVSTSVPAVSDASVVQPPIAAAAAMPLPAAVKADTGQVRAVPSARRVARELGVDLASVVGSGRGGVVRRADVEAFAARPQQAAVMPPLPAAGAAPAASTSTPPTQAAAALGGGRETRTPFRGVRRKIAEAMSRSKSTAAHFTVVEELDVSDLVRLRESAKKLGEEQGVKVTYMPFIMKATALALARHPELNGMLDEKSQELVRFGYVNLGIAADTVNGLIVPVIREVQTKGILQLARELNDLAERTRAGKVRPEELQGGTFTITNAGNIGGILATPIINYPEIGILGVHRIVKRPGVVETPQGDRIEVRHYMNLSASVDHRLSDGANAARFLVTMKRLLENPGLLAL
jgi:pyruvate dehydrogenase E2 component (dihydrolipoamide acetyltransferase)